MINKKYVAYYRVSTERQGRSGLGLQAQKLIIQHYASDGEIMQEYKEVYTGKDLSGCTELRKAIEYCKDNHCALIMAKSDRFRNVKEALQIMDELGDGNLICCDIPSADRFTFTIFFAIAEREAFNCSIRTKAALAVSANRGVLFGRANPKYGQNDGHNERMADGIKQAAINKNKNVIESGKTMKLAKILKQIVPEYNANLLPEPLFFLNWSNLNISLTLEQKHAMLDAINTYYPELADRKINGEIFRVNLTATDAHNLHKNLINSICKFNENNSQLKKK